MIRYLLSIIVQVVFLLMGTVHAVEKLTLAACIQTAFKNQPALKAAREGILAGAGRETQARSPYFPQIKASTGYSESHSVGGAFGDSISKSYSTTLAVNQVLYDFGRTGNTLGALSSGVLAAELEERRVAQDVAMSVKQSYFALLQAKRMELLAQKTLEQAERHLKQAEEFFRAGSKPKYDVTRTEVEVNNARFGLINARNSLRARTIALYVAMGLDPAGDLDIEDAFTAPAPAVPLDQATEEAVRRRPEMLKAEVEIEAARSRAQAERSQYLPILSASGAYNWSHGTSEMGIFKGDIQDSWNAGVILSLPLFEGGITKGKVGEAQANLRIAEAHKQTIRQTIVSELSQAYADIESAAARISVTESSIKKARENLELAQGRYEAGLGPYMEVTDAQLASINAETDQVQALYDQQLAAAKLEKAMGRMDQ